LIGNKRNLRSPAGTLKGNVDVDVNPAGSCPRVTLGVAVVLISLAVTKTVNVVPA